MILKEFECKQCGVFEEFVCKDIVACECPKCKKMAYKKFSVFGGDFGSTSKYKTSK